jgi:hypothetical protein
LLILKLRFNISWGEKTQKKPALKNVPQMLFLSLSNQGFAIIPVKVRNYIIKAFAMQKFCASLFRLINANISVNEQSEWFHGDTDGGHFIHTVRHVYILNHDHFTDIVSALAI